MFKKYDTVKSAPDCWGCGNRGCTVDLNELASYAKENYHMEEQHKWADFPGFSVLADPITGKWVALLMRQWDQESGEDVQRCDLKCGQQSLAENPAPWLGFPFRMKGKKWVGVRFDARTDPDIVFRLFDRAVHSGEQRGYTIVLEDQPTYSTDSYSDTPLSPAGTLTMEDTLSEIPQRILDMMRLYEPGDGSLAQKCRNFYRQGRFMEDYEDELPWHGEFSRYFPSYHDLNFRQLRGYFTWRTELRKGRFRPVTLSFAYIYLYELLCGIGCASAAESLEKLREFEQRFLDAGYGDDAMRRNLRRWMPEFAILHDLPAETVLQYADPDVLRRDNALAVLKSPAEHTDGEVFSALCVFAGEKLPESPVIKKEGERGRALFAALWRTALAQYDGDLFTACFGALRLHPWQPLANALHWEEAPHPPAAFVLDPCRRYFCRGGVWEVERYESLRFDEARFQALLHEGDRAFRKYLKTGHTLRVKSGEAWAAPFAAAVIAAEQAALAEAARPKITIDFSGLEKIRKDAGLTRDSLLSDEEKAETQEEAPAPAEALEKIEHNQAAASRPDMIEGLDALHTGILRALLRGQSVRETIQGKHLFPSVVVDTINEALFDRIGDSVLEYDGSELCVVEDYREDLSEILEEPVHE